MDIFSVSSLIKNPTEAYKTGKKIVHAYNTGHLAGVFLLKPTAVNLNNFLKNLLGFCNSNPIAKAFTQYHQPGFEFLAKVIDAYIDNQSKLNKDIRDMITQLDKFDEFLDRNLDNLKLNREIYKSDLNQYIESIASTLENYTYLTTFQLSSQARYIYNSVNEMIESLDTILSIYCKIYDNYTLLYKQVSSVYFSKIESQSGVNRGITVALNLDIMDPLVDKDSYFRTLLKDKITNLINIRNEWSQWIVNNNLKRETMENYIKK
jgi:hypothetical protein